MVISFYETGRGVSFPTFRLSYSLFIVDGMLGRADVKETCILFCTDVLSSFTNRHHVIGSFFARLLVCSFAHRLELGYE
jgi:hypothetical protein